MERVRRPFKGFLGIDDGVLDKISSRGLTFVERGEEGAVFRLDEPLPYCNADCVKVFHTNYIENLSHNPPFELVKHPRFAFSTFPEGFLRLYYLNQLANDFMPDSVINLHGVELPSRMPLFFDESEEHCPRDAEGKRCFPKFYSTYVEMGEDQSKRIRGFYEEIRRQKQKLSELDGGGSGSFLARFAADPNLGSQYTQLLREKRKLIDDFNAGELALTPDLRERSGEFGDFGLWIIHPEVNYVKTHHGGVVFLEVGDTFHPARLEAAVRGGMAGERTAAALYHF